MSSSKRRLIISVDIEALPARASGDHVDRLIWGRFPDAVAGIGTMMDIAERHGVALTMFLDLCERDLYGEAITDVGQEIIRRGHDLELHAHPGTLQTDICRPGVANPPENLLRINEVQAQCLADFLVSEYRSIATNQPIAFRGGGYRYNRHLLDALRERGVIFNSSYNANRPANQPGLCGVRRQFRWENGVLEIPISCVENFRGTNRTVEFNFNTSYLPTESDMSQFIESFYSSRGDDAIAILVMHSWSLLAPFNKETGHFDRVAPSNLDRFSEFLASLTDEYEVLTMRDLLLRDGLTQALFSDTVSFTDLVPVAAGG